eukprot:2913882-Rhodomonas_salina.1
MHASASESRSWSAKVAMWEGGTPKAVARSEARVTPKATSAADNAAPSLEEGSATSSARRLAGGGTRGRLGTVSEAPSALMSSGAPTYGASS